MDQHSFPEAVGRFQTACIMVPDSDIGCLNAGIALLAMKQYDQARKILTTTASRDPQNVRAWYNIALLDRAQGQTAAALENFQKTASLDPEDAATHCFLGLSHMAQQNYDRALAAFRQVLLIDPLNATAESGIAEVLGITGDNSGRKEHQDRYDHLIRLGLSQPLGQSYSEQGNYSLAAEIPPPNHVMPAIPVRFTDVTQTSGLLPQARAALTRGRGAGAKSAAEPAIHSMADFLGSGACVFDFDGDGRPDIFLVDADGNGNAALYRNLGHSRFADVTKTANIDFHGAGMGCAVGDYDNDGHPDLAVSSNGGVRLYHNQGDGTFADVTDASGIKADGLVLGISFVDYDRDGDLDLFITRFHDFPLDGPSQPFTLPADSPPGNMLWRSNGDGTFSDDTAALGLAGHASSTGAIASDFAGHGALDLLTTGWRTTPALLTNLREGAYKPAAPWGAETQSPTAGGVAFDFDKDGLMDIALTHWSPITLGLWRNVAGKKFAHTPLPDPGWMRAWGIAALDYDNDGWIDLVAVGETFSGEGRVVLLRNEGAKGFHEVTAETGLDKIALHDPRSIVAFDAEGDGSVDLLITQNHRRPVLLKATGGNKNNWAEISLRGDTENTIGLGVRVEMFSGALRQTWELPGASGYLSQGPPSISAGLGREAAADAVRVKWSRRPIQVLLPLPAAAPTMISQADADAKP
jgi:tetratricopeptide (TPR) repeat protein